MLSTVPDQALLRKTDSLVLLRRQGKVLALQPGAAAALLLDAPAVRLLLDLARPRTMGDILRQGTPAGMGPDCVRALVEGLAEHGMLSVNGRTRAMLREAGPRAGRTVALRLDGGCSPYCPSGGARLACDDALAFVDRALGGHDERVTVLCTGRNAVADPDLLEAILLGCQERCARIDVVVHARAEHWTSPAQDLVARHGAAAAVVLESGSADPSAADVLEGLRQRGVSLLPSVIVREPAHFAASFTGLVEQGFRTFRVVAAPRLGHGPVGDGQAEAWALGFMDMARAAAAFVRGRKRLLAVSDLDRLVRAVGTGIHLGSGLDEPVALAPGGVTMPAACCATGATGPEERRDWEREWEPRCGRCPVRGWCGGFPLRETPGGAGARERLEFSCRYHQRLLEELLWMLREEPDLVARLGGSLA